MNAWLVMIPVITALLGWLINRLVLFFIFYPVTPRKLAGIRFHGLLPRKQQQIATGIAGFAAQQLALPGILEEKIADPANFQKLMPVIEEKIDHFLRVKLKESMPMVGMFVGDKTIQQLKTVFVTELETIFPVIMQRYATSLQQEFDVEKFIGDKLLAIPPATWVKQITGFLQKELQGFLLIGVLSGLITGAVALLLSLLIIK